MLLCLTCIVIIWANLALTSCLKNGWTNLILISLSSIVMYASDNVLMIICGWAGAGSFSAGITSKKIINKTQGQIMLFWSSISTLLFILGLSTLECWNLSDVSLIINKNQNFIGSILILLGLSVKSLLWPFSIWLYAAMKGISPMSSLVHSLTVVFGGTYICIRLLEEGWLQHEVLFLYNILYLISVTSQTWMLVNEFYSKRVLGCSTSISINTLNTLMSFDTQLCFCYGILHGLSKAYLFVNHNTYSYYQNICLILLGGFPMTLNYFVKHNFIFLSSNKFILWVSIVYTIIIFKYYETYLNNFFISEQKLVVINIGKLWISLGSILGSFGKLQIGDPIILGITIIIYKLII